MLHMLRVVTCHGCPMVSKPQGDVVPAASCTQMAGVPSFGADGGTIASAEPANQPSVPELLTAW